jgi:hypothetical protein
MAPSFKYKILGRSGPETRKDDWIKMYFHASRKNELISGQGIM